MQSNGNRLTRRVVSVTGVVTVLLIGGCQAADQTTKPTPSTPAGAATATTSPEPAELAALRRRPLRLPTLSPGDECPITKPAPLDPPPPAGHALSTGGPPSALGHAPLFPDARFYGDGTRLRVHAGAIQPDWYGTKTPWASRTGYLGWALIRTARLDGPGRARVQLQLAEGPNGVARAKTSDALPVNVQADWQFFPGGTEVTRPGCYAYQVDGSGFTEVIVFRAELDPDWPATIPPTAIDSSIRPGQIGVGEFSAPGQF